MQADAEASGEEAVRRLELGIAAALTAPWPPGTGMQSGTRNRKPRRG